MKIITPHHKPSAKVTDFKQIKKEAEEMITLLNAGNFTGKWREGIALSHCQVSENPFAFFVTHKSWDGVLPEIVINPRVIEQFEPVSYKEACMSYPFRDLKNTKRYWRLVVEFEVPSRMRFSNGLKTEQLSVDGLAAIMFQHEIDHHHGQDIYSKFVK